MERAAETLAAWLQESAESRWAAAAFEINRIYNILEKAFERLCETFENHLEKRGRYLDTLIDRVQPRLPFLPSRIEDRRRRLVEIAGDVVDSRMIVGQ
jgi:hypothetical protein